MNKPKTQFWKSSPFYKSYRRVQKIGSFKKWAASNPDERARIEQRHESKSTT